MSPLQLRSAIMPLSSTERKLVELRKKGATAPPPVGRYAKVWLSFLRNWTITSVILGIFFLVFLKFSWSTYLVDVSLPASLYGLSRGIMEYRHRRYLRRTFASAYLTLADLPPGMDFNFQAAYRKVGNKGSKMDREQLKQLCLHVTVEALGLKAVGVSLDKPALRAWFAKKYEQASELAQYIVDFDTNVKESLVEEAARRKAQIAQMAEDAALAAFWARNAEGPVDFAQWTTDGLKANTTKLKLVKRVG